MDKYLTWIVIGGVILVGVWSAEKKSRERAANPTQYSTPFMRCMSLNTYREQTDCLQREGIQNMEVDDPQSEPRRR